MTIDLPAPVRAVIDAANAHDTDAFLACFTMEGVVDDWGREFHGPERIRGWSDHEFIGAKVQLRVSQVAIEDVTVVVTAQVSGDGFNGPSHFTFAVEGDHLTRMTIRA
jgi:hypothetical protein